MANGRVRLLYRLFPLFPIFTLHSSYPSQILPPSESNFTSIRVKDLKDPAKFLLRSAHQHGKLCLNAGIIKTTIIRIIMILAITVIFSAKSMLPLLSSSNMLYTESHKMPPYIKMVTIVMINIVINIIILILFIIKL